MDSIDAEIVRILQANARCTASEISGRINLSIPAVSERMRKLEESKVIIRYTAIVDPGLLNKTLEAMMFVSLSNNSCTDNFVNFVSQEEEILECHYITGEFDYILKIITENTKTLESILRRIKNIKGVNKTHTIVVLRTVKNDYSVTL